MIDLLLSYLLQYINPMASNDDCYLYNNIKNVVLPKQE